MEILAQFVLVPSLGQRFENYRQFHIETLTSLRFFESCEYAGSRSTRMCRGWTFALYLGRKGR